MRRTAPSLLALLALAACSGTPDAPATAKASALKVALTDAGCALTGTSAAAAGAVTLEISNEGTDRFDEVYVVQGTKIEGEGGRREGQDRLPHPDPRRGQLRPPLPWRHDGRPVHRHSRLDPPGRR